MSTPKPTEKKSFHSAESQFTGSYAKTVFETLKHAYRPYAAIISVCLFSGLLGRLLLLANANIIGYWVDSFCNPQNETQCRPLPEIFQGWQSSQYIAMLIVMSISGFILTLSFRVIFSRVSAHAISQIYDETTYRTSRLPMSFYDSTPAGRIITRFSSDYGNIFRLFGGPLAEFLSIMFDLICMIVLISVASPFYLPVVLITAVLNFLIYKFNQGRLRTARRDLSASRSPSIAHFAETAQGASTVRSFIKQKSFAQRFYKLDGEYLWQRLRTTKTVLDFSFQMNVMTAFLLITTGALGWYLLNQGLLSVGSIGVAFGFVALSGNSVQMFFEWMTQFEEAMVGVERLDEYIRKDLEPGAKLPSQSLFQTNHPKFTIEDEKKFETESIVSGRKASVEFKDVWFRYRADLPYVLKNLSFEVHAGERFGIIGRTGSGKSSLIQALFHLYPIERGTISISGLKPKLTALTEKKTAEEVDLLHFRKALSFISQDPALFKGPLWQNLDLHQQHDNEKIFESLRQVGLTEWANPESLNMQIEERGRNLSQGERQLICMARCLLQEAPVVIMDEATSSVDPQSEEILVRATDEFFKNKTQIIIAHRLSTLLNCDRILWLQNGEVRMIGTPSEVLPIFQQTALSL